MSVFDEAMLNDKVRSIQSYRATADAIQEMWPDTAARLRKRADEIQASIDDDGMYGLDQWLTEQSGPAKHS